MAGYSKRSLPEKLGIKAGDRISILNPPESYGATLGALPERVTAMSRPGSGMGLIQCFVKGQREAELAISTLKTKISPRGVLWVSWPKGTSGVQTDLNENGIRQIALRNGLVDVKVCP